MDNYICIKDLSKIYSNQFNAIDKLNLNIKKGEIFSNQIKQEYENNGSDSDDNSYIDNSDHSEKSTTCNVKVPLYIHSRYQDILAQYKDTPNCPNEGWVVTNTRFTKDALAYGKCAGLYLLSWDHPEDNGLKDRIDRLGLYPITVSTLLTNREKQFLLSRDIVLCRQLANDVFYLDHLGVSETRKAKILSEISMLCNSN